MKKFIAPAIAIIAVIALAIILFVVKGTDTNGQPASIISIISAQSARGGSGTPNPNLQYVWSNGTCWSVSGNLNGGSTWSPTPFTLSGCPAISVNTNHLWMTKMATTSIPMTKKEGTPIPATTFVWANGGCWSVSANMNGGYNWSITPYTMSGCPATNPNPVGATTAK